MTDFVGLAAVSVKDVSTRDGKSLHEEEKEVLALTFIWKRRTNKLQPVLSAVECADTGDRWVCMKRRYHTYDLPDDNMASRLTQHPT